MSVRFNKTGVIEANGTASSPAMVLVDEYGNELTDEHSNVLYTEGTTYDYDYSHGFIEGYSIMSIFDGSIIANEFIEW